MLSRGGPTDDVPTGHDAFPTRRYSPRSLQRKSGKSAGFLIALTTRLPVPANPGPGNTSVVSHIRLELLFAVKPSEVEVFVQNVWRNTSSQIRDTTLAPNCAEELMLLRRQIHVNRRESTSQLHAHPAGPISDIGETLNFNRLARLASHAERHR